MADEKKSHELDTMDDRVFEQKFARDGAYWQQLTDEIQQALSVNDWDTAGEVFAELQAATTGWLLKIAGELGPIQDAEDAVVATYTEFYRCLVRGDAVKSTKALLRTIVKRRVIDMLRRAETAGTTRPPSYWEDYADSTADDREGTCDPAGDREPNPQGLLNPLIGALPRRERDIFLARHLKGLSVSDTAQKFGITPDQVKKLCQSALRRMRGLAEQRGFEDVL